MPSWLIVLGFWALSSLICLPVLMGGQAAVASLMFLFLLIGLSTFLYSERFAALVDRILRRDKAI
jgi:uncharacterized membrane protein YwzB